MGVPVGLGNFFVQTYSCQSIFISVPLALKNNRPKILMNTRILRWRKTAPIVGYSRMTISRMEKADTFPQRICIKNGSVGWLKHEVEDWFTQRMAVRV